jgi:drug/metabolite transporter (DMT)-like permease
MNPALLGIALVALSTLFDGGSQICMKKAASKTRASALWVAGAVIFSIVEAVIYTFALRRLSVGIAFAVSGLSFVVVTILARWILGEHVSLARWVGVVLIVTGASMVAAYA